MYSILKTKSFLTAVLIAVGLFCTACSGGKSQSESNYSKPSTTSASTVQSDTSKHKLQNVPDFTLKRMNGKPFTLSDHKGQVIVLNVWATWCPPCRKEIPDFVKIQKEMRDDGVLFVGVSVDKKGWSAVRPFAKKYGINYPIMVDDGTVSRKYGPFRGIPTTFIITKKGKVAYGGAGMISGNALKPALEKLLKR